MTYPVSPVACVIAVCLAMEFLHHGTHLKSGNGIRSGKVDGVGGGEGGLERWAAPKGGSLSAPGCCAPQLQLR